MRHLPDPIQQPQFYDGVPAKRLIAWFIDTLLIFLFCLLILPFTAFTGIFFFPFLMLVTGFAYRVMTLANGSATLGMRLMAIEMRDADDRPFGLTTATLHTGGYTLSWALPLLQLISIVLMASSTYGQSLTDMALSTTAINRRTQR